MPIYSHRQASARAHRALRDGDQGEALFKAIYDSYAFTLRGGKTDELRGLLVKLSYLSEAHRTTARARKKQPPSLEELLSVVENVASTYGEEKVVAVLENPSVSEKPSSWPWCDIFDYEQAAPRKLGKLISDIKWELGEQCASIGMLEADAWVADVKSNLLGLALNHAEGGILPPLWNDLQSVPSFECRPPRPLWSNDVKYENKKEKHAPFKIKIVSCVKYLACLEGIGWDRRLPRAIYDQVAKWHTDMHGHIIKNHVPDWNGKLPKKTTQTYVHEASRKKVGSDGHVPTR